MSLVESIQHAVELIQMEKREHTGISSLPWWEGRRAHERGLLPWQSVLCRPDQYKLEFAGRFGQENPATAPF